MKRHIFTIEECRRGGQAKSEWKRFMCRLNPLKRGKYAKVW